MVESGKVMGTQFAVDRITTGGDGCPRAARGRADAAPKGALSPLDQTENSSDILLPVPGPTNRSSGRRRKTAGRIALVLGVLLALLLAVVLVFAVRFRSLLDPETLADRLEPRISQAVNRPVTIEGAELRLWPRPGVVVEGIRIANRGMFSETALATADAVVLEPRLLPLLKRQIVIDRIVVRSPRALLVVADDGTSNFGDFVPERSESGDGGGGVAGLSLDIKRVELVDGRVGYRDGMRSRSLQLDGVNLRTDLDARSAGSIGTVGTASAEQVIIRLPEAPGNSIETGRSSVEWSGRVAGDLDSFELDRGELEAGPFRARLSGQVSSLGTPVRILDLALYAEGLALEDLVGELDSGMRLAGSVELDLRLQGEAGPDHSPAVSGLVTLRDGTVMTADDILFASDLDLEAQIQQGEATVTASGKLLDGQLSAAGTVALDSMLPYDIQVQADAGLDRVLAAFPAASASPDKPVSELDGRLAVDARVAGRGGSSGQPRIDGTATLTEFEARIDPLRTPIRAAEIPIRLAGETASWQNVRIGIGESEGTTSGQLHDLFGARESRRSKPTADADVHFGRLDLDAVLPERRDEDLGWGRIALARLGGRSVRGSTADELAASRGQRRPSDPSATGTVRLTIDTLLYGGAVLDDVDGTVQLSRQRIEVPSLQFGAYGGRGTAAASLELGSGYVEPFGLQLELRDVRAEEWLARHTPLGNVLSGTMSLDLELAGGLDTLLLPGENSLAGSGEIRIRDGAVAPNPLTGALAAALGAADPFGRTLKDWASHFRIDDGAVHLSDGSFEFERGDVDMGGSVAFDGALDLALLLRPDPEQVRSFSDALLEGVPESARRVLSQGGPVELGLRVGGRLDRPTVAVDPSSFDRGLDSAVGAGRSEIERRGLDLLRRLTEGAADTTAVEEPGAQPDSVRGADTDSPR